MSTPFKKTLGLICLPHKHLYMKEKWGSSMYTLSSMYSIWHAPIRCLFCGETNSTSLLKMEEAHLLLPFFFHSRPLINFSVTRFPKAMNSWSYFISYFTNICPNYFDHNLYFKINLDCQWGSNISNTISLPALFHKKVKPFFDKFFEEQNLYGICFILVHSLLQVCCFSECNLLQQSISYFSQRFRSVKGGWGQEGDEHLNLSLEFLGQHFLRNTVL